MRHCPLVEAETYFPMFGMSIQVLQPGEPNATYHWETEQEDFLVLAGEALLITIEADALPRRLFAGLGARAPRVSSRFLQRQGRFQGNVPVAVPLPSSALDEVVHLPGLGRRSADPLL